MRRRASGCWLQPIRYRAVDAARRRRRRAFSTRRSPIPQAGRPELRLLRRVGKVDPSSLDDYRRAGGYDALRKAIDLGPEGVVREVIASRLLGRGGAAFPTGRKWEALLKSRHRAALTTSSATPTNRSPARSRIAC